MTLVVVAGLVVGAVLLLVILTLTGPKRDAFSAGDETTPSPKPNPKPPIAPGFISKERHDKKMREMFKRLRGPRP